MAELQRHKRDRVRRGPADDRGAETAARHVVDVRRDVGHVLDRQSAQHCHEDGLREPGRQRHPRLGRHRIRSGHVPVAGGHLAHVIERLTGGCRRFREMLAGPRLAPADRLQGGGCAPGRHGQAFADRGPQAVGRPDPLGGDRRLGELVPGRVHRHDEVGQPGQPEQDQGVQDERNHRPPRERRRGEGEPDHACPHG